MGTAWRKSTRVPALRVPMLLMGLGQAARALRQPSKASTPSESTAPDSASARAPPGSTSREARRGVANLTGECPRRARARQLHRGPRTRPPLARPGHAGCAVGGCVGPRWYGRDDAAADETLLLAKTRPKRPQPRRTVAEIAWC